MKKSSRIGRKMLISEVVKKYPETAPLFLDFGLHCIGCAFAKEETIEEAAKVHQIDLEKFLSEVNKLVEK